jgi:hypothetical protein
MPLEKSFIIINFIIRRNKYKSIRKTKCLLSDSYVLTFENFCPGKIAPQVSNRVNH